MLGKAGPKEMGGVRMSGAALAALVEKWTDHMNVPIGSYRANSAEELLGHIMCCTRARARTARARANRRTDNTALSARVAPGRPACALAVDAPVRDDP